MSNNDRDREKEPKNGTSQLNEMVGTGSGVAAGAAVGAVLGGPVGALLGGLIGAVIGNGSAKVGNKFEGK